MIRKLIVSDGAGLASCQVLGERITLLANHDQTGRYEVYLHDAPAGVGPPPHFHSWDEAFYVIEGAVDFDCAGMLKPVTAGGFVHIPAGTVHHFRLARPAARVLGIPSDYGVPALSRSLERHRRGADPDLGHLLGGLSDRHVGRAGARAHATAGNGAPRGIHRLLRDLDSTSGRGGRRSRAGCGGCLCRPQ